MSNKVVKVLIFLLLSALMLTAGYFVSKVISLSFFVSYFTLGYFLLISLIAYTYRKFTADIAPTCEVIIPAYNEGKHVYETIKSVAACDYDPAKLRITAVDDGSTDDNRAWIQQALDELPQVRAIYLPHNSGKKHAMSAAIKSSEAEILVTIDSDSIIEKEAITNIVRPFVDAKIGAVAGNVRVQNINDGIIPQMMDIIFVFCYEFIRSSQSKYGTVLCTPGALSAYRRSAVLPVLESWLRQRFLGEYTSIGEDRALTCMLLREEWLVVYQSSAVAYTTISANYVNVCKMLLRWIRGDIRENILMFSYVFRRFSLSDVRMLCLQLHYIAFNIGIITPIFFIPVSLVYLTLRFSESTLLLAYLGIVTLIWSIVPAMIYAKRYSLKKSLYAFVYSLFSMFCLSWIPLYAMLTLKNNKWLTRR
ncbi:MAG: glycosyltransferase [Lentisphaeria bacterium]|nr:glycosyltransferase [Lentisphaeria bacterium]